MRRLLPALMLLGLPAPAAPQNPAKKLPKEACFSYPTHPPERPWGVHEAMQKRRGQARP